MQPECRNRVHKFRFQGFRFSGSFQGSFKGTGRVSFEGSYKGTIKGSRPKYRICCSSGGSRQLLGERRRVSVIAVCILLVKRCIL